MSDVVISLPVRSGREAQLFGVYLDRFIAGASREAERLAPFSDAPYMMVHSHPLNGHDLKVITFQQADAAWAFRRGWERTKGEADGDAAPAAALASGRPDRFESANYA
jgi:hypothetical protein